MGQSLIIVESPAKARTIKKYLGRGYQVVASVGHIKDLPQKELGVDIKNDFEPTYVIIKGKQKVLNKIIESAEKSDEIYLAPDPDREGEAIAWHIGEEIAKKAKKKKIHRILFNEITEKAIRAAIADPKSLDKKLFDAQQARRILDRLVGYQISPILWKKVRRGLSAGRVQSVAVRIICEREAEIAAFVAKEYWSIVAHLLGSKEPIFEAKLAKFKGEQVEIPNEKAAKGIAAELDKLPFVLEKITKSERKRNPTPPFITSKLQQEAARKLGFTARKTMGLAQQLYEGVELGDAGLVGLITYMRTDSPRVSDAALNEVRSYIGERYGKEYMPAEPVQYKGRRSAQEAHEAVRPTSLSYPPEAVEPYLDKDALKLYDLIWKRFVASQMNPAIFDQTAFDITAGQYAFRATGQIMRFAGFMAVYMEGVDEVEAKDEEENPTLPELSDGETLKLAGLDPNQHFTQPPPRFTEASLVKELEERGIGRPSTYAAILSTIQDKEYVKKIEGRFHSTELGVLVNDLLVGSFPEIMDIGFTAQMEEELDDVEEGKRTWVATLKNFYGPFEKALKNAAVKMRDVKRQQIETEYKCEKCGSSMVVKWGRHGEFLACSKYPECKTTREFKRTDEGEIKVAEQKVTQEKCEKCGSPMVVKRGRFGEFLACTRYPECKTTKSIGIGVACPDCGADLVARRSGKGKTFYGCSKYPKCKFALWNKPLPGPCPKCGYPILTEKYLKKTNETAIVCPQKDCGYSSEKT